MDIKIKKYQGVYLLLLTGELDLYHCQTLENLFVKLCDAGGTRFVIDFTGIKYIDSSGVGSLLKLKNSGLQQGRKLVFTGITGETRNVLNLANLLDYFPRAEDYRTALKNLSVPTSSGTGKEALSEN